MLKELNSTLLTIPKEVWSGLFGVMLGSSISILGVILTNRGSLERLQLQLIHERKSQSDDIKRERLEELYTLTENWLNSLASHYLTLSKVMQGKISYNDYLDLINSEAFKPKHDFSRLQMIINIYATELKTAYESVIAAREKLNEIYIQHKRAYEKGDIDGTRFLKPYIAAQQEIEKAGDILTKEVAALAKRT